MRVALVLLGIAIASPSAAATIRGLVYHDANRDGRPSAGEPGVAGAVVAFGIERFVTADVRGQFEIEVADDARGIVWVRVPDGFVPGPVWARWDGSGELALGLRRLAMPVRGPFSFVVAADTHIGIPEPSLGGADLARAAKLATALEPAPAFFTVLGDITQGSRPEQYAVVRQALADLPVPWIPVPGNHDWYDGGAAWFAHHGPDNYSFDIGGVHFVVWNMALSPEQLRAYLGADLARVADTMMIVALTHDPPREPQLDALRAFGVDYVLTGHTHSNRVVDHGGIIELNTEPFLMGGLDFAPAGYRIVTIDGGRLSSDHRTLVDEPFLAVVAPRSGECTSSGSEILVAAELGAGASVVTARIDCASPFELRHTGNWLWRGALPRLAPGNHVLSVEARAPNGAIEQLSSIVTVCEAPAFAGTRGPDWPQVGGRPDHTGAVEHAIVPPLASRWVTALGNHVVTSPPIIAGDSVYVATTDLAGGNTGGVAALELATGAVRWRVVTAKQIRGGVAFVAGHVVTTQIDGEVLAIDAADGRVVWRHAMSARLPAQAGAVFSPPAVAGDTVFVGHQRAVAALDAATGKVRWNADPVPAGFNSQSSAAIAIGSGLAVGTFQRQLGGVIAWDARTGIPRWRHENASTIAINAAAVIDGDGVYIVTGATDVIALDLAGNQRWRTKLDAKGFEWGHASVGTPALAHGLLIVPTMYGALVALDAATGRERWRHAAAVGPLRATHYRGAAQPAFAASPIVTGDLVWAVDTAGTLSALDVRTGIQRWSTLLGTPVLAGLAASGDWLVVASYDGSVRAFAPAPAHRPLPLPSPNACAASVPAAGCCSSGGAPATGALTLAALLLVGRLRHRYRRMRRS